MRIHYLLHAPYEGPAAVETWAAARGFEPTYTRFYEQFTLPSPDDIDWLVVMGGPMNVYQEDKYPWLSLEKELIRAAIRRGKKVLGICLGAQLVSVCMGGRVTKSAKKEIGWHNIYLTEEGRNSPVFRGMPHEMSAFHWHEDTFQTPLEAHRIAYSDACDNQAFCYNNKVVGLQFHLESSMESAAELVKNCGKGLVPSDTVQPEKDIFNKRARFQFVNEQLFRLLDNMNGI